MAMIGSVFSGAKSFARAGRAEVGQPRGACRALGPLQNCRRPRESRAGALEADGQAFETCYPFYDALEIARRLP